MGTAYTGDYVRELEDQLSLFQERLDDVVGSMNDASWDVLYGWGEDPNSLSLETLKRTSVILRDMVETSPMFRRGHELRFIYTYARGWRAQDIKPATKAAMEDGYNYDAIFSNQGLSEGMKARHVDGNRFVLKNDKTGDLYRIPLGEITDAMVDENDASRIQYIRREWYVNQDKHVAWYPTDLYRKADARAARSVKVIKTPNADEPVRTDFTIYHTAYNRPAGATWGVPDFLSAMLWAKAYAAYLKDNATLVKAYSRIALKISAATATGSKNVQARVESNNRVGGTAVFGQGLTVEAMPTSGSQVDFSNGRPLAAMVASAFGVSIVALLADPGTGGSYGVAETLDPPTLLLARTLQGDEVDFYQRLLRSYANPNLTLKFPSLESDPAYRETQGLAQLAAQGILHREEVREKSLDTYDIENPKTGLPKADGFNNWADPHPPAPVVQAPDTDKVDPTPGQGKSGAAGSINQGTNNDNRNDGEGNSGV